MVNRSLEVGLDSQCLSYIIDALEGIAEPTDSLAEQRVALVRIFLYRLGTLWTTPTVKREFERIGEPTRRAKHQSWTSVLFGVYPLNDPEAVWRRATELGKHHPDIDDCLVLAEAEDIGLANLLSFDTQFVNHLSDHARLNLARPVPYWESLRVPRGERPNKIPWPDNPLAAQAWWGW